MGTADNGNVTGITNNRDNTRSQSFTYDALNRIASAQTQTAGVTIPNSNCWGLTFGYDAWGNLLSSFTTGPAGCSEPLPLNVSATPSNQISAYCYDAAGNMLDPGACPTAPNPHAYVYNAENQLVSAASVNYLYDGDGKRVQKSSGKLYWYGMGSDTLDESDASGNITNEFVFFNGTRIAKRDSSGNVNYYFADHLGTARVVTNATGTILDDSDFYPFGGERPYLSSSGNAYKFTGKERDAESGLDEFGARYYSSALGRFTIPDWAASATAVPYADFGNPQSLNLYSYVKNNPLATADPDGHCCWEELQGAAVGTWNFVKDTAASTYETIHTLATSKTAELDIAMQTATPIAYAANEYSTRGVSGVTDQVLAQGEQGAMEIVTEGVLTGGLVATSRVNSIVPEGTPSTMLANAERGAASEARVLNDLGVAKNRQPVVGTEGKSIPDFQTSRTVGEIKDARQVSNTKQLRIQKEAAQQSGRQHELHTGTKTHVTAKAEEGTTVTRRDDLGPK